MKTEQVNPLCRDLRRDCVCMRDGRCLALTDSNFGNRPCPFYKPKEETDSSLRSE